MRQEVSLLFPRALLEADLRRLNLFLQVAGGSLILGSSLRSTDKRETLI